MFYDTETTISDLIAAWDAGDTIWSIEMGGVGPGYEQAIQVLVVELLRDHRGVPLPKDDAWSTWGDATISRIDTDCGGLSGAQEEAAKLVAYRFLKKGPLATYNWIPEDRRIQVSNYFPCVKP